MGIQGLLPFLKKSGRFANLKEFKGQCAAVDVYCWLHKGAFSCADKLVKGEPTDGYIVYVMRQVSLLLSFDIKPVLVFDGCHLPSKALTEAKRRENRERNRRKAKELLREGNLKEARECFQRCVDVTSEMAHRVIQACREKDIDIIVAPYEADAQLAYLDKAGIADLIVTEDSDLVLFGCRKIIFKLDSNGGGMLIEREKLHLSMGLARDKFFFEKFRNMCVLSGCDYLPSLHGIGLVKAKRFVMVTSNPDIFNTLPKLPSYLNMPSLEVPDEYRHGFLRAINTIEHQLVFDPISRTLRPLNPYTQGTSHRDFPYCGHLFDNDTAFQLALGNVNVQTKEVVDSYNPDLKPLKEKLQPKSSGWNQKAPSSADHRRSIWSRDFRPLQVSGMKDPTLSPSHESKGEEERVKTRTVELPRSILKKRKMVEEVEPEMTMDQLEKMYRSQKKPKEGVENERELSKATEDLDVEVTNFTGQVSTGTANASPSQEPSNRNPFAVRSPASEASDAASQSETNYFSALKNFSSKGKTIVRSRYFKSTTTPTILQTTTTVESPAKETPPFKGVSNLTSLDCDPPSSGSQNKENFHESSTPKTDSYTSITPTPKKDTDSPIPSSTKAFHWKKMSNVFSYQRISSEPAYSSPASRNGFNPPKIKALPDTPESRENLGTTQEEESNRMTTEGNVVDGVPGKENGEGSFGRATPLRNPFSVKDSRKGLQSSSSQVNVDNKKGSSEERPPSASNLQQRPTPRVGLPSCRTPGLARNSAKKQLSLKEMFAFKKSGLKAATS